MTVRLLAATAVAMALCAGPVVAPDAASGSAQVISQAEPRAPGAEDDGLRDIVVTAQWREEPARRAGIAIDVVSGADIVNQGITRPADLNRIVPALILTLGDRAYLGAIGRAFPEPVATARDMDGY